MQSPVRVAYTLEQCWHRVPGGTATSALRTAVALADVPGVEVIGVAGRHRNPPEPSFVPSVNMRYMNLRAPYLYETWLRFGWPTVESVTGDVDVVHCTGFVPPPSKAPMISTLHDVAWRHRPDHFTRHGVRVFERSLAEVRRRAELVLCPSTVTMLDAERAGIPVERLRLVPWGVEAFEVEESHKAAVRAAHGLPREYLLFVGTVEPRKNLGRLVAALERAQCDLPLVVAGSVGWGIRGWLRPRGCSSSVSFRRPSYPLCTPVRRPFATPASARASVCPCSRRCRTEPRW